MAVLSSFLLSVCATFGVATDLAGFDSADATSTYSNAFAPSSAIHGGSGYWCSGGGHGAAQSVSWTGMLDAPRTATGLSVHWAYSPEEVQVLVSADGMNFAQAACWRSTSQKEVSFVEHIMFDRVVEARAVTVVMRGSRSWGYFGLNAAALLAESGSVMLVSGVTTEGGELCAVGAGGAVQLAPCLDAVASGSGADVFEFGEDGLLHNSVGGCVSLSNGALIIGSCRAASQADDGRAKFELTSSGQLRIGVGNQCVVAEGKHLAATTCDEAAKSTSAADKFLAVAVPAMQRASSIPRVGSSADDAAVKLTGTIGDLHRAVEKCGK